jgi:hypothetical protein
MHGVCHYFHVRRLTNLDFFFFFSQFKIDRQKKEMDEMEALCGYLEEKLVTTTN